MTDATVPQKASRHARDLFATTIGIISKSGGNGKNELSAKATAIYTQKAFGESAFSSVLLYKR